MKERRRSKRFLTNFKAYYSLQERGEKEGKECTVINISNNGAGLVFYTPEKIDRGSKLFLDVFISEFKEPIFIEGIVRWVKKGKKDFIGGIEVISESDKEKLEDFIKLIQES